MDVFINQEQGLFVESDNGGYSCLGFDVVFKHLKELVARIGEQIVGPVIESAKGTIEQYEQYCRAVSAYAKSGDTNTWFGYDTPKEVRTVLERCRKDGSVVRIFYGDTATGRDWLDECDTIGRIGRSNGVTKVPLIVPEGEHGGPAILDDCIVKIMDAKSGHVLYQHPKYYQQEFDIRVLDTPIKASRGKPYTHGVWVGGIQHANFTSHAKAAAWVGFMAGETCRPFD